LVALSFATIANAQAQDAGKAVATSPTAAETLKVTNPDQVLATVNNEKITKAEFIDLVKRYEVPTDDTPRVYQDAIETLINVKLINQFLARKQIAVSQKAVDEELAKIRERLEKNGQALENELALSGNTLDEVKKQLAFRQQWITYLQQKATPGELERFVNSKKDLFNGTQVKASHILIKVDDDAPDAEKAKARARLLEIKKEIESKKLTFAQAANKYSQDDNKAEGDGGDIGYFSRSSGYIEEFVDAAFKLRVGQISDPIETILGYHLIMLTDRKEGTNKFDLKQQQTLAMQIYSAELQKMVLLESRKAAKIDIKPMPPDLFESILPPQVPATTTAEPGRPATPKR
jgi:parvulin-like peptidyl-prolyl isomerase